MFITRLYLLVKKVKLKTCRRSTCSESVFLVQALVQNPGNYRLYHWCLHPKFQRYWQVTHRYAGNLGGHVLPGYAYAQDTATPCD